MKKPILTITLLLASSTPAHSALVGVALTEFQAGRPNATPADLLINPAPSFAGDTGDLPTPVFIYDTLTGLMESTGVTHVRALINPSYGGRVFDQYVSNLTLDIVNGVASATSFECVNGGFSFSTGINFCGSYRWGDNATDESSITYGPGTAWARVIGGDDEITGDPQTIDYYDGLTFFSTSHPGTFATMIGATLELRTADWLVQPQSPTNSAGKRMVFTVTHIQSPEGEWLPPLQVVPVPPAVWLFGSALGLLGLAQRRMRT